ncbi:1-acyl-sn-glycerol-3-phosphate acyltransferase [Gordonia sp. PP30]|uniref:lysophospholipid acyltransferase family protein n=1 Tax=unclassified Gordonia (in: high G+C Gram-positive bacteria) TaxID=2657482 RepID=UPI001FFF1E3E|nr:MULTISPECIES: lysophospholipid acyltransferase family protein [unclassified Gordonia (in: high G+C Gram-positive bacteria)]UQE73978.1 1-acyl-sn-glycerol-3-phosphate acyltransferase [Gordonia sp. PP30]
MIPGTDAAAPAGNPWVPRSSCGTSCVPPERRPAGKLRVVWRMTALSAILLSLLPLGALTLLTPRPARVAYWRFTARCGLVAIGLRVRIVDHRPRHARRLRGALVVANHISFLDVFAVAVVSPARFVAKREVLAMGAVSPLLRCFGVLAVSRGALRQLPAVIERVAGILDRGRPVVVFPEGTTWCGVARGRFRPAFFQTAIDTGTPVVPIRLCYLRDGYPVTSPGYLGDDGLADTLRRVLRARGLTVSIAVHPPVPPAGDRRDLAAVCQRVIHPPVRALPVPPIPAPTPGTPTPVPA